MITCADCKGSGQQETGIGMVPCDTCKGSGLVQGRCKDCKWWIGVSLRDVPNGAPNYKNLGQCDIVNTWTDDAHADQYVDVFADAADDTDLRSALITGPMFGCVRMEPRNRGDK